MRPPYKARLTPTDAKAGFRENRRRCVYPTASNANAPATHVLGSGTGVRGESSSVVRP